VTSSTDQNGKTTTYTYDLDGRVKTMGKTKSAMLK